jgi:hypothetical protein
VDDNKAIIVEVDRGAALFCQQFDQWPNSIIVGDKTFPYYTEHIGYSFEKALRWKRFGR